MEHVEVIRLGNMAVKRDRIELGQNCNLENTRINTITDWNVNQAVFSGNWNSRFGTFLG